MVSSLALQACLSIAVSQSSKAKFTNGVVIITACIVLCIHEDGNAENMIMKSYSRTYRLVRIADPLYGAGFPRRDHQQFTMSAITLQVPVRPRSGRPVHEESATRSSPESSTH